MKNKICKVKGKYYLLLGTGMAYVLSDPIFCDRIAKAGEQAAKGIYNSIIGVTKWLLAISLLIAGLYLAFGTERQSEGVKERIPRMLVGLILIVGCLSLAALIWQWFSVSTVTVPK